MFDFEAQYGREEQAYNLEIVSERKELETDLNKRLQIPIISDKSSELKAQLKTKEQKETLSERLRTIKSELEELDSPGSLSARIGKSAIGRIKIK